MITPGFELGYYYHNNIVYGWNNDGLRNANKVWVSSLRD
jgi:hypothetical protein